MGARRARKVTPTGDCIEVAVSKLPGRGDPVDENNNDANGSSEQDGVGTNSGTDGNFDSSNTNDSLDAASKIRAHFQLSLNKPISKSSRPQKSTTPVSSRRTCHTATMPSADTARNGQPAKRSRQPTSSSRDNEDCRKRQKLTTVESPRKDSIRFGFPANRKTNTTSRSMTFDFMGTTSKPSTRKTNTGRSQASIKPDPQPVCSDLFRSSSTQGKKSAILVDLTDDVSGEPSESPLSKYNESALQKELGELTIERDDYRKSLHAANAKIEEYKEADLLQKARAEVESDERHVKAAEASRDLRDAREKSNQLAKDKTALEEQLKTHTAGTARLQQDFDKRTEECKKLADCKRSLQEQLKAELATTSHLQQDVDDRVEECKRLANCKRGLEEQLEAKTFDTARLRQNYDEQAEECKKLASCKRSLEKQVETGEDKLTHLRQGLDTRVKKHASDIHRLEAIEMEVKEHKLNITRLQAEAAEAKKEFDEQKWMTDWYEDKFLKFKRWYYAQEKVCQEKDVIIQRFVAEAKVAAQLFDYSMPMERLDASMEGFGPRARGSDTAHDAPMRTSQRPRARLC